MILSVLLSTAVGTLVGLKLVRLASRTRRFPELAIGVALFSYAGLGQTTLFATKVLEDSASVAHLITLLAIRLCAYYVTLVGMSMFTWRVFGAKSRWRQGLTLLLSISAAITIFASFWAHWQQLTGGGELASYGRYAGTPQFVVMFAWMSVESFVYYRKLERRHRIGLASSIVTNRLAVWGATAGASSMVLVGIFGVSMIRNIVPGEDALSSALISMAGLINGLGWWLTFMPPAGYTQWVERADQESESMERAGA